MKHFLKRLISILVITSLAISLLPSTSYKRLIPTAYAANEKTLFEEYSYMIPNASCFELAPVIPPAIIDDTRAIVPDSAEQHSLLESTPAVADFNTPKAKEDDSRFISILLAYNTFSALSSTDSDFFCNYTGILPEMFSWLEMQGISLHSSLDYATMASALECSLPDLLALQPSETQIQTLLAEASVYSSLLKDDLKGTDLDFELRSYLLQGYECERIFDSYALSQIFGGGIDDYLDSDPDDVLSNECTENSSENSNLPTNPDPSLLSDDDPDNLIERFEYERSQLMSSASPLRSGEDVPDLQTAYLGAPFSFVSGEEESIELNSGALTYSITDFTIPGINGLDLVIGRNYSSQNANIRRPDAAPNLSYDTVYYVIYGALAYYYVPGIGTGRWSYYDEEYIAGPFSTYSQAQAFAATCPSGQITYPDFSGGADLILQYYASIQSVQEPTYYYTSTTAANDHLTDMYGLGHGWSFKFSSVETIGDVKYLHLSDGRVYEINQSAEGSHLVDYPLTDMVFSRQKKGFSNGVVQSEYRLKYQDGTEEFFSNDGKLIGIRDRFQNTISFVHSTQNGYPYITITDTVGRVTVISGQSTSDGHTMTVQLPNNVSLSYSIVHDNDARALSSYSDPVGNVTYYSYTKQTAGFDINHENTTTASVDYLNLTTVTHPTLAQSVYTYAVTERNLGSRGLMEVYRITSRTDLLGSDEYNCLTYSYAQDDYTGYPHHKNKKQLPASFSYYTTVTDGSGVQYKSTFDRDHVLTRKDVQKNTLLISSEEYTYINKLPTQIVSYSYSPDNQLSPMVSTICREYDEKGRLTSSWSVLADGDLTDVEHKTTYTYNNSYGLPLSTTYKTDQNTTVELRNTIDSYGRTITRTEVYVNNDLKKRTDYTYDGYGNLTAEMRYYHTIKHHGHIMLFGAHDLTEYTYTNNAYLSSIVNSGIKTADGTDALASPNKAAGTVAQYYTYDVLGRMTGATDGNGNSTAFAYDALGNVTQITNPDSTTITYSRNYLLNTLTVTNENGSQTRYSYTPLGLEYEIVDVLSNNVISRKEYDNMSRLSRISEFVYGSVTEYSYDDLGRAISETVKQGNDILSQLTYCYDDAADNGLFRKVTHTIIGDTDAPSVVTTQYSDKAGNIVKTGKFLNDTEYFDVFTFDYVGNLITRLTAADAAKNLLFSEKYEYDENGRVTKAYNAANQYIVTTYDVRGRLISSTDYAGTPTEYTYDDLDRLLTETITIETGVTASTKFDYDAAGNIIQKRTPTNAVGNTETWSKSEYTYDSRQNLTAVKQYDGVVLTSQTCYTFDGIGNVLSMTVGGHTTEYVYDRFGNVVTTEDALGHTESNSYSSLGKLLSKTDRNGITTTFSYDALGRMLASTAGTGASAEAIQFSYTKTGQIASESNEWQQTCYSYDALGRTVSVEETELNPLQSPGSALTYTKAYTYDLAGNRTSFTLTKGNTTVQSIAYTYDNLNRLATVSKGNATQASYTYDVNGNRASLTYPNGVTETYSYNLANWITGLSNQVGSNTLSAYTYAYYASGNRKSETDQSNKTTSYTYDGLGRLTQESETNGKTIAYSYDASGNRTQMTVTGTEAYTTAYTYDANNRLLTETKTQNSQSTATAYTYDSNGNTLSKTVQIGNNPAESTTYSYDYFDQLVSVTAGVSTINYAYNAEGIRTAKLIGSVQTSFLLDGGNVAAEAQNGVLAAIYLRGINLVCREQGTAVQYYLFDAHADVIALTNETGTVTKSYEYDAFGCEKQPDPLDTNPFRYCGEYFDVETGSYYLRARYYAPKEGRFFAEDAVKAGLNWYIYCGNNPVAFIDPWGHEQIVVSGGKYSTNSGFQYEFIEPAIKQIYEWLYSGSGEGIAWIVADEGWSILDRIIFFRIALDLGINLVYISDKQELFDYINNGQNRNEDPITAFSVFSHGFTDDGGVVSLGYNYTNQYNENLNINKSDICKMDSSSFNAPTSLFYSCNTGTSGDSSFAQEWVNRFDGTTTAFVGQSYYGNINLGTPIWLKSLRKVERLLFGFSLTGSYNYPVPYENASTHVFTKN